MASQGPLYPGTVTTEVGPSGDNDWTSPGNVGADDGVEAQVTAASYDANDHTWRLKAQNFGFTIPAGATIDGIIVEIERRAFAGAAEDQEVRLYNAAGTLVGDDKQTATAWPSTVGVATYGSSTDTWNASLTATDVNDVDFGVALIVLATAANTDIGVDYIRATVHYTVASQTVSPELLGGGTILAPEVAQSVAVAVLGGASIFAPAGVHQVIDAALLGTASLFAPSITSGITVGPMDVLGGGQAFAPSITQQLDPALLGGATLFAPAIAQSVAASLLGPAVLFAPEVQPSVGGLALLGGATIFAPAALTQQVAPPVLGGASLLALTVDDGIADNSYGTNRTSHRRRGRR